MRKLKNEFVKFGTINGYTYTYKRIKNDINGNLKYEICIGKDGEMEVYRTIAYNIVSEITDLIESLEESEGK